MQVAEAKLMPTDATIFGLPQELFVLAATAGAVAAAFLVARLLRLRGRTGGGLGGQTFLLVVGGAVLAAMLGAFGPAAFISPLAAFGVCAALFAALVGSAVMGRSPHRSNAPRHATGEPSEHHRRAA